MGNQASLPSGVVDDGADPGKRMVNLAQVRSGVLQAPGQPEPDPQWG
jgi:hypothetical protein